MGVRELRLSRGEVRFRVLYGDVVSGQRLVHLLLGRRQHPLGIFERRRRVGDRHIISSDASVILAAGALDTLLGVSECNPIRC